MFAKLKSKTHIQTQRISTSIRLPSSLILAVTGWLGGELSFRHRIGVLRNQDR
jgi:hypothetical protein